MTISLVVGYLNYRLGQVGNGHLLYVYFGSDWGTVLKIGRFGTMTAPKSGGMHCAAVGCNSNYYNKQNVKVSFFREENMLLPA